MDQKRHMLRHFLAALAYRVQKALRDMPSTFPEFRTGREVRTPHQLICHMTNVLGYSRTFFIGGSFPSRIPKDFEKDLAAFHEMLAELSAHLAGETPLRNTTEERLLQGPFSDAMTHAHNTRLKAEVDEIVQRAERAGGKILKKPQQAEWGGYSGYFSDPDGYLWEVAWSADWRFHEDGSLVVP